MVAVAIAVQAAAMRVVITNDDGFESANLQALFAALKAAGHEVILSAPYSDQSGTSAVIRSYSDVSPTGVRSASGRIAAGAPGIGPTTIAADQYYINSTPATAVVYGIEVLARAKWNSPPELVISGPNAGNNLGTSIPHSGTIGAAITALNRGIPAIAVSAANGDASMAPLLAEIVIRVIAASTERGKVALPVGIGLSVNVPALDRGRLAASYRFAFTQVVSDTGTAAGLSTGTVPNETDAFGEGGTVTVSPIQGTYRAPLEQSAQVLTTMRGLFASAPSIRNPQLINVSMRGLVESPDAAHIVGFVISGSAPKTILIRASGPALAQFGVTGWLADPLLQVFDQQSMIATNDNWSDDPSKGAAIAVAAARAGAFAWAVGSRDAALLVTVAPGAYTIVIRGVGDTTGVTLAEVYDAGVN